MELRVNLKEVSLRNKPIEREGERQGTVRCERERDREEAPSIDHIEKSGTGTSSKANTEVASNGCIETHHLQGCQRSPRRHVRLVE